MAENIKVLVPEAEVAKRIEELGRQISEDYAGKQVHMICVLKGGVFFMCELAKRITVPVSLDFMSVSSYGDGTSSSGVVKIAKDLDEALEDKDVLVVEDIVDSGRTLYYLLDILGKRRPKSMRLCTLLDKRSRCSCFHEFTGSAVQIEQTDVNSGKTHFLPSDHQRRIHHLDRRYDRKARF